MIWLSLLTYVIGSESMYVHLLLEIRILSLHDPFQTLFSFKSNFAAKRFPSVNHRLAVKETIVSTILKRVSPLALSGETDRPFVQFPTMSTSMTATTSIHLCHDP